MDRPSMSVQTWLGLFVTYLVHDGILLYHRPALHTEPVSRSSIVLDDRAPAFDTHCLRIKISNNRENIKNEFTMMGARFEDRESAGRPARGKVGDGKEQGSSLGVYILRGSVFAGK